MKTIITIFLLSIVLVGCDKKKHEADPVYYCRCKVGNDILYTTHTSIYKNMKYEDAAKACHNQNGIKTYEINGNTYGDKWTCQLTK